MDMPNIGNLTNMSGMLDTLKDHVDFPATKDDIVSAMDNVSGVPGQAKDMVMDKLPDREYKSIDDIKNALGL